MIVGKIKVDFSPVEAVQEPQKQAVIGCEKKQG